MGSSYRILSTLLVLGAGIAFAEERDCETLLDAADNARALEVCGDELAGDERERFELRQRYARLLVSEGRLGDALSVARDLAERRRESAPDSTATAWTWNWLGGLYTAALDYEQAVACYEEALRTFRASGTELDVAYALHNLAGAMRGLGDLRGAQERFESSLAILRRVRGEEHADVALSMSTLGSLLLARGLPIEARRMQERALAIRLAAAGEEPDFRVGQSHVLLAEISKAIGEHARSLEQLRNGLEILQRTLEPTNLDIAAVHRRLALGYETVGDTERAAAHLHDAIEIQTGHLGGDHVAVIAARSQLAELRGDLAGAARLERDVTAALERDRGSAHLAVGTSLWRTATLLRRSGRAEEARPLVERALSLRAAALGERDPQGPDIAAEKARILWLLGDPAGAFAAARHGERLRLQQIRATVGALPEREALSLVAARPEPLDLMLSVATVSATAPEGLWDLVVRGRALVFDEMAARAAEAARDGDPAFAELARARSRLAGWVARGPDEDDPRGFRERLEAALEERERIERSLAERNAHVRDRRASRRIGWGEVSASVPEGAALVGYVRFEREVPVARGEPAHRELERRSGYVAFVRPATSGDPVMVSLGDASDIDRLVEAWRAESARKPPAIAAAVRRAEERYRFAGRALREAIWDPLLPHLRAARRVFVVPDGELHLVNLGTLPDDDGGYLIERAPTMHVVSTERDLVAASTPRKPGTGLLLLGAPDFGEAGAAGRAGSDGARRISACRGFGTWRVAPLPAAEEEVRAVKAEWADADTAQVLAFDGAAATEAALYANAAGRRVVHLATHGFYLGDECPSVFDLWTTDAPSAVAGDNPLLLSGLALAGFNRRDLAGDARNDGVVTAEEIATLDLDGVEWVVLSACETGLGRLRTREGVLGLRRAFRVAGAGTLIVSLREVQDESTMEWMRELYRARAAGADTAEAVRIAGVRSIERRRERGRSTHPFYWGAFLAAGDWR